MRMRNAVMRDAIEWNKTPQTTSKRTQTQCYAKTDIHFQTLINAACRQDQKVCDIRGGI